MRWRRCIWKILLRRELSVEETLHKWLQKTEILQGFLGGKPIAASLKQGQEVLPKRK
jgi:hypothetical protein